MTISKTSNGRSLQKEGSPKPSPPLRKVTMESYTGAMRFRDNITIGGQLYVSRGGTDVLLVAVNAETGVVEHVTQLGDTESEVPMEIDYELGNVFLTGQSGNDIWVVKLDADGLRFGTKLLG